MSRRLLERIRSAIVSGEYDLTRHAIDEMAEDGLGIFDVETGIYLIITVYEVTELEEW